MRYLSLFSGIEAATVAWEPLGWTAAAYAEIDPFPSALLAHRYPAVRNLGDVTTVDWKEWARATEPVDVCVFGSPCQSFSVAGKRLGLDDPRGNLALYALSVVRTVQPRYFLFENVPGLLSSAGGRDFGAFLGAVGECGYQCAWRILDAQYFGLAQRRARLFVVGHLGDWRRAAAVLFERESVSGDPAPRRETRQSVAGSPAGLAGSVSRKWSKGTGGPAGDECYNLIAPDDLAKAVRTPTGGIDREDMHTLIPTALFDERSVTSPDNRSACRVDGPVPTLHVRPFTLASQEVTPIDLRSIGHGEKLTNNRKPGTSGGPTGTGVGDEGDPAYTVSARQQAVAQPMTLAVRTHGDGSVDLDIRQDGLADTLRSPNGGRAGMNIGAVAIPIIADATRDDSSALTPSPDAEGRVRLRDPGIGIGEDGDPMFTVQAAATHAVAVGGYLSARAIRNSDTSNETGFKDGELHDALASDGPGAVAFESRFVRNGRGAPSEVVPPLKAQSGTSGKGDGAPLIGVPTTFDWQASCGNDESWRGKGRSFIVDTPDRARALSANKTLAVFTDEPQAFKASHFTRGKDGAPGDTVPPLSADADKGDQDILIAFNAKDYGGDAGELSPTLRAGTHDQSHANGGVMPAVLVPFAELADPIATNQGKTWSREGNTFRMSNVAMTPMQVRRLTPRECERLQGFPDDYTLIPYRGSLAKDGPRYKALGNSMAVPCMRWLGERIQMVEAALGHVD